MYIRKKLIIIELKGKYHNEKMDLLYLSVYNISLYKGFL